MVVGRGVRSRYSTACAIPTVYRIRSALLYRFFPNRRAHGIQARIARALDPRMVALAMSMLQKDASMEHVRTGHEDLHVPGMRDFANGKIALNPRKGGLPFCQLARAVERGSNGRLDELPPRATFQGFERRGSRTLR